MDRIVDLDKRSDQHEVSFRPVSFTRILLAESS